VVAGGRPAAGPYRLGRFTGAILLAVFARIMAWESIARLIAPVDIALNQGIRVAALGLIVNGACVFIPGQRHNDGHGGIDPWHDQHHAHGHDHNLRAAHLPVLADALTSLLAIFAHLAANCFGLVWMDPIVGIVGAALVSRWSLGLLRSTGSVLLDQQGPENIGLRFSGTLRMTTTAESWICMFGRSGRASPP